LPPEQKEVLYRLKGDDIWVGHLEDGSFYPKNPSCGCCYTTEGIAEVEEWAEIV
jgi:hypothetical protein